MLIIFIIFTFLSVDMNRNQEYNPYELYFISRNNKDASDALRVQYNNAFRVMMGLPRFCNISGMFVDDRVPDFHAIINGIPDAMSA